MATPVPTAVPIPIPSTDTTTTNKDSSKHVSTHFEDLKHHPTDEENIVDRMNNLDPPVTLEEEKKVLRKIDLRLPPFLLVLYMFTWLDVSLSFLPCFSPTPLLRREWSKPSW